MTDAVRQDVTVRRGVLEDEAELLALDQAAWSPESGFPSLTPPERDSFFSERSKPEYHLVALHDERIVGYAKLVERYPIEEGAGVFAVHGLAVSPEARGLGIGSTLMQAVEDEVRRRGGRKICLNVFATNTAARKLYERQGYEVEGHSRAEFVINGQLIDDYSLAKFI
ncbi:GNAT family N-acetyltransferase [Kribbella sp. NBC_01245]|uniref:GNAT family N-acetyltransferase n=1 Tax=Kribbella sp. NBC_01245 TaxID=2903578 RepID=UPI002E2C38FA|nr:GNAT family N-acetyltransferase [Kribbella sp. NBC_01245]